MKKIFIIVLVIVIAITIGASLKSNADKELINYTIKDINEFLASKELEGRLTGTEGNKKAEEFISEYFKSLGLETLKDNTYLLPYTHNFVNFNDEEIKMVIEYENGTTRECIAGKDFLPKRYNKKINLTAPISKEIDESSFLLVNDNIKPEYSSAKGILLKTKYFHHYISIGNNKPAIQISEDLYNDLANNKCNINYEYNLNIKKINANNVVGKISGEDNNSAIILSAHFDHVGKIGDTIYYGALDNSSGVSILLDLTRKLKEYSINNNFKQDIIICAFNGEESGLQGSQAFAQFINDRYKNIWNINFDCIGIKDRKFTINNCEDSNIENCLSNDLYDYLNSKNYDVSFDTFDSFTSDHVSFEEYGIPAVNIGQDETNIIHSELDTVKKLDIDLIEKFSNDMFEFIVKNDGTNYNEVINTSDNLDIQYVDEEEVLEYEKMLEEEAKDLELNQYKHIMVDGIPVSIEKDNETYNSLLDLKKIFSNINIPENISNYKLHDITVYCSKPSIDHIGEIGKIYTYDNFSSSNIYQLVIRYSNKDDNSKILEIKISKTDDKSVDDIITDLHKYNNFVIEKISNDNQCYWIEFSEDKKFIFIIDVINITENDDIFYIIRIDKYKIEKMESEDTDVHILDWFEHSKDKTIEFMKNIDFNDLINGIFG